MDNLYVVNGAKRREKVQRELRNSRDALIQKYNVTPECEQVHSHFRLWDRDEVLLGLRFMEHHLPDCRDAGKVYDMGCGFWQYVWMLRYYFPRAEIVGVDCMKNPENIYGEERELPSNVFYESEDIMELELPKGSVDVILDFNCVSYESNWFEQKLRRDIEQTRTEDFSDFFKWLEKGGHFLSVYAIPAISENGRGNDKNREFIRKAGFEVEAHEKAVFNTGRDWDEVVRARKP